jgi:predicted nucleic acid-binding Zn ribbon protein
MACKGRYTPARAGHVYCSAKCRQNAYAARMRAECAMLPALVLLPRRTAAACLMCGQTFKRANARQVYCSTSCRSRMSRLRRAAAADVLTLAYGMPGSAAADVLDVKGLAAVRGVLERAGWHFDERARRFTRTDTAELAV